MAAIGLALVSALAWGTGDFLGGMAARRYALLWVLLASALGGVTLAAGGGLISGDPIPPREDMLLGAAAGVCGVVALSAFYRALAVGTMSIVAPITATGAAIPVLWGVIGRGESLSALSVVAILIAVTGVILASREQDLAETTGVSPELHRQSVLLAIVAAIGFGTIFALIAEAGEASIYWPAAMLKLVTLGIVAIGVVVAGRGSAALSERPRGRQWFFPYSIGFFDVGANITFAASTHHGALAISSVVSSLYPVTTILLAFVVLRERLVRTQLIGVAMALAGVAILAAAS
ncbi:MAG: EamA family transporter [Solirubrobacterales bacterium]